jgi:hypothetical protein
MANELIGRPNGLPSVLKARLHKTGQTFNVSTLTWVNFSAGNWSQYLIDMTAEDGGGKGNYLGDLPAAAADAEYATFYEGTTLGVVRAWQILRLGGPFAATGVPGQTMRAVIKNGLLTWRRTTSAWVTHNDADWADYLITLNEDAGTGVYSAALPVGAEAWTHIRHHNGTGVGEADLVQFRNTAVPVPTAAAPVARQSITYSPLTALMTAPRVAIFRGSGVPIQFTQTGTPVLIDTAFYDARLGAQDEPATAIRCTIANGKLIDAGSGVLVANFTADETRGLPTKKPVVIELWRTGSGDDNVTTLVKANVTIVPSITP